MIATPTPTSKMRTFADLQAELGGVPAHRILLYPTPGTATETDVLHHLDGDDKRLVELVNGTLVEKPMGAKESLMAGYIYAMLFVYVSPRKLGLIFTADGPFRMNFGNVRVPDVSFVPKSRFPGLKLPADKVCRQVPSLVVEVISDSNTKKEIAMKLKEYFALGVELAWVVEPKKDWVRVHTAPKVFTTLGSDESLSGGTAIPGFELSLTELFNAHDLN